MVASRHHMILNCKPTPIEQLHRTIIDRCQPEVWMTNGAECKSRDGAKKMVDAGVGCI